MLFIAVDDTIEEKITGHIYQVPHVFINAMTDNTQIINPLKGIKEVTESVQLLSPSLEGWCQRIPQKNERES